MSCTICDQENSKYKCPVCYVPYCSVNCCKVHKENPCSAPPAIKDEASSSKLSSYNYPTEDTVPIELLKALGDSVGIKKCLDNPHLRVLLKSLDESQNPATMMEECMQEPIFTEFVDECLNVISPESQN